jgi:uncharacterized protein
MFARLLEKLFAHHKIAGIAIALAVVGVSIGIYKLKIDFRFQNLVGSESREYRSFMKFADYWGSDDNLLFIAAQSNNGSWLSPANLQILDDVSGRLESLPSVKSAISLPRIPLPDPDSVNTISFITLKEEATRHKTNQEQEIFRKKILADRQLSPSILSRSEKVSGLFVELAIDSDDLIAFVPAIKSIRDALQEFETHEVTFACAGIPAVRADLIESIESEQIRIGILTILFIILTLVALYRSWHGLIIPGLAATIPLVMLYGFMGWMEHPIGILAQAYITLIPVIAVADTIHILNRFHDEARNLIQSGEELSPRLIRSAIIRTYKHLGTACFFTSVTTAIGFLSLFSARMSVLHDFGIYAAVGICFSFFVLLFVVPLLLFRIKVLPPRTKDRAALTRALEWVSAVSVGRPKQVIAAGIAMTLLCLYASSFIVVNNRLSDTLPKSHPTNQASELLSTELGGVLPLQIDLSGAKYAVHDPAVLEAILEVEQWAYAHPQIRSVQGPAHVAIQLHQMFVGTKSLPKTKELATQLFFLGSDFPNLNRIISDDGSRSRILLTTADLGAIEFQELSRQLNSKLSQTVGTTALQSTITGIPFIAYTGFNRIAADLFTSLLLAVLFIGIIIGVLFKSHRMALISLIPNLFPLLGSLALMGVLGWDLDTYSAMIFTVALGIAVDDSIHHLSRLREEQQKGGSRAEMLTQTILHTGKAVVFTSILLIFAFATIATSGFPANRVMGTLGACAIGLALLCDLFLLPAMLMVWGPLKSKPDPP